MGKCIGDPICIAALCLFIYFGAGCGTTLELPSAGDLGTMRKVYSLYIYIFIYIYSRLLLLLSRIYNYI